MRNMTPQNRPPMPAPRNDMPAEAPKVKQVPKWVTASVISFFVLGSGVLVYRQWFGEPSTGDEIELKEGDIVPRSPGALARRFAPPPEGVRYNRNRDSAVIRSGDVEMRVTLPAPKHEATDFYIYYARGNYATKEQGDLLAARARLVSDNSAAKYAEVTKEQRKALKEIAWPNMQPSDADRDRMKALWTAYVNAKGEAQMTAQDAIVTALKEIGDANLEKTKATVEERCEKITSILSSKQLEKFRTMGQPQPAAPKKDIAKVDVKS